MLRLNPPCRLALVAIKHFAAGEHAGSHDAGFLLKFGEYDGRVFADQVERVFSHGAFDGLQYIVAGLGKYAPDDDKLGVEQVDESGEVSSQFLTYLLDEFDTQQVFSVGCFDNVGEGNRRFVVFDALREYRLFPFVYTSQQFPI